MWRYQNPVDIHFGPQMFGRAGAMAKGRRYAVVTYDEPFFDGLLGRLEADAGSATLVVRDVLPNPDLGHLEHQVARFRDLGQPLDLIVAIGGGSVIDSAKAFAAAKGDFSRLTGFLGLTDAVHAERGAMPLIAVPTTAGTGSEVTCWATIWQAATGHKHSLSRPSLYPRAALVDPVLMAGKPLRLTVSTGLDALSHALESLWNINANPVSTSHAVTAAREIIEVLPLLARNLDDLDLRTRMARAATFAGLAFSNTKTAIAHSLSYPITLRHNVQHGIACSFTLPMIMRSVARADGECRRGLEAIFGEDLAAGSRRLEEMLAGLGIALDPASYGVAESEWSSLVADALTGERGRNFIGAKDDFLRAARGHFGGSRAAAY